MLSPFALTTTLELSQIAALRKGFGIYQVGPLAKDGVDYLGASTSIVKINGPTVKHIDEEHGGLSEFEMLTMSFGLQKGLFISDPKRRNHLIISYIYADSSIRYKMVVKAARAGTELWVCTFHRMKPRQTKALLCRGPIIKNHN